MNKEDVVGKINYDDIHFPKEDAENALFESFVTFEHSKRLKELGFQLLNPRFFYNEFGDFSGFRIGMSSSLPHPYYQAPTLAQACKWLRCKDILIHILPKSNNKYMTQVWEISSYDILETLRGEFDSYEQAQSAGIDVALGLLEKGA